MGVVLTPLSTDADSLPFLSSRFASLETRNRCNNNHQRSFLIETDAVQIHKSYSGCYMPWFDFSSASVSYYLLIYLLTNVDVNVIDVDIPPLAPFRTVPQRCCHLQRDAHSLDQECLQCCLKQTDVLAPKQTFQR